jgi:large subunit ribosomal protein L15
MMRGFEGGQMPLHRRMPKRGFTNIFRTEYTVINLDRLVETLEAHNLTEIDIEGFRTLGLVSGKRALVKVLGSGELTKAITVQAHKFSKSATEKITKAGGKVVVAGGDSAPAVA